MIKLVDFYVPNNTQEIYDLNSGDTDGFITKGDLCKVNVNLNDDGWNVNVSKFNSTNRWNAGNRSFFRNKYFLPLNNGSFYFSFNPFFPPP